MQLAERGLAQAMELPQKKRIPLEIEAGVSFDRVWNADLLLP